MQRKLRQEQACGIDDIGHALERLRGLSDIQKVGCANLCSPLKGSTQFRLIAAEIGDWRPSPFQFIHCRTTDGPSRAHDGDALPWIHIFQPVTPCVVDRRGRPEVALS